MNITFKIRIYPESSDIEDELFNLMQDDGIKETIEASISRIIYDWLKYRDIEVIVKYHHAMTIRKDSK